MKYVPKKLSSLWQRGFTMVELAIVLVIAGLILVAVLKGTDTVNKAKAERAVADLRGLQGMLLEYQKRTGRLPGDCNNNGVIGYFPAISVSLAPPDSKELHRKLPVTPGSSPTLVADGTDSCVVANLPESGTGADALVWNDMRRNNIVDPQRLPAELAKNAATGGFYAVGNMTDGGSNTANVIVVYDVPVWLAEAIDTSIDGVTQYSGSVSAAQTGRVRRWSGGDVTGTGPITWAATNTYANGYALSTETRDTLIAISYQFDTIKLPN